MGLSKLYLIKVVPLLGIEPSSADYKTAASPFMLWGRYSLYLSIKCLIAKYDVKSTCSIFNFLGSFSSLIKKDSNLIV